MGYEVLRDLVKKKAIRIADEVCNHVPNISANGAFAVQGSMLYNNLCGDNSFR